MVVDILGSICGIIAIIAFVCLITWFVIYTTKSEQAKRIDKLESELEDLKIVNVNLAKYNDTLLKDLKK